MPKKTQKVVNVSISSESDIEVIEKDEYVQNSEEIVIEEEKNVKPKPDESASKKDPPKTHSKGDGLLIDSGNFAVVPGIRAQKQDIVRRSLPNWLRNPQFIPASLSDNKTPVDKYQHLLSDGIMKVLKDNHYEHFFPVQSKLISELLGGSSGLSGVFMPGGLRGSDICCSAPTGSGKTLAFVVPIVQMLSQCSFRAIRCLVVVPVVELASQVFKVFQLFAEHTQLKIGLASGLNQLLSEQHKLVGKNSRGMYTSKVDVVVCTPGRLVDHLQSTPGFNLNHLRFIVIDEADRMMEEVKHDWLELLERAVYKPVNQRNKGYDNGEYGGEDDDRDDTMATRKSSRDNILDMVSSSASLSSSLLFDHFNLLTDPHKAPHLLPPTVKSLQTPHINLQKLLFSATLSHNPEKLQQLRLHHPKLFTSVVGGGGGGDKAGGVGKESGNGKVVEGGSKRKRGGGEDEDEPLSKKVLVDVEKDEKTSRNEFLGKYVTPADLNESFIQSDASRKPLILLHLLHHMNFKSVLCFTNSVESAKRLSALMLLMDVPTKEFSSGIHVSKRARVIKAFNNHTINMIVASDAMSRGLDLEHVDCVVSYNVPSSFKTYIHRVGRTARAGVAGSAVALLENKEVYHFKKIMRESGKGTVKEVKVQGCLVEKYKSAYEKALKLLPKTLDEHKYKLYRPKFKK